ncbi:MAG: hypothetical protein M1838_004720 [Thelocarpon superellum]|nr:MAG: hypothetical protein M1838_004720 [Thelocarpon superellum]
MGGPSNANHPSCLPVAQALWPPSLITVATDHYPCNKTSTFSACCQGFSFDSDTCIQGGLCVGGQGYIYRGACTDPTFKDPSCAKSCTEVQQSTDVPILSCRPDNHSFCCYETGSDGCCGTQIGLPNGLAPSVFKVGVDPWPNPTSTSTGSTSSSTSASTSNSNSADDCVNNNSTQEFCPEPSPSASTVGAAVGVPLGVALLTALAFIFWQRRGAERRYVRGADGGNGGAFVGGHPPGLSQGEVVDDKPPYSEYPPPNMPVPPRGREINELDGPNTPELA